LTIEFLKFGARKIIPFTRANRHPPKRQTHFLICVICAICGYLSPSQPQSKAMTALTIWANPFLTQSAEELLIRSTGAHRLILAQKPEHVLDVGTLDPRLLEAEIVFGQPDPGAIRQSGKLRWLQLSSAGYARYDNEEIRSVLKKRLASMTNSSSVFDEPCGAQESHGHWQRAQFLFQYLQLIQ